jgi:hypothetical protein
MILVILKLGETFIFALLLLYILGDLIYKWVRVLSIRQTVRANKLSVG